jgi:N-acyl-D-aspartate/D-glutamate deacylase
MFGKLSDWVLLQVSNPELEVHEQSPLGPVAAALGYDDIIDAFCEINIKDELMTRWHGELHNRARKQGSENDEGTTWSADQQAVVATGKASFKKIADDPYGCPCISDGGAHTKFMTAGHFGIYYLIYYVRENEWVTLEEAHWKLSGLPSLYAGLGNRGTLVEGAPADIFIYDFDQLGISPHEEVADYPAGEWRRIDRPIGLEYVLVNGQVTMESNVQTNAPAGKLIRQGEALLAA